MWVVSSVWASECALVPSLGPAGGTRAGAPHHVGNLEVTFVSLPASLPWIKMRYKINVSQNLRAKMFDARMKQFRTRFLEWFLVHVLYTLMPLSVNFKFQGLSMIALVHSAS